VPSSGQILLWKSPIAEFIYEWATQSHIPFSTRVLPLDVLF